jgi:hypothetical protein
LSCDILPFLFLLLFFIDFLRLILQYIIVHIRDWAIGVGIFDYETCQDGWRSGACDIRLGGFCYVEDGEEFFTEPGGREEDGFAVRYRA